MSRVYLAHFERKLHHAQHYIGFTTLPIELREKRHRSEHGAKILRALQRLGIEWKIVRVWEGGDRALEQTLKKRKKARELCPVCRAASRRT